MPAAIDDLMSKVQPAASIFTEDAAKKLDPEWMKWIKPVPTIVPKKKVGQPLAGDENKGSTLGPGETYETEEEVERRKRRKKKHAAHRQGGGTGLGVEKMKIVTPRVQFVKADDMPEDHPYIYWAETSASILISDAFPPYVREVARWMEKTIHPKSVVEAAVQQAYTIEYAAYIIDSNAQRGSQLLPEQIENLKSDMTLYGKALGCQSLTEMIAQYLKATAKAA
jgi:hypothetical protein